jgi:Ca-activated chloride channel family protein
MKACVLIALLLIEGAGTRPLDAQGATIEVTPPGKSQAGSRVTIKWSGPNGSGDFITITRKGAELSAYLDYAATSDGRAPVNPVSLRLPAEPGAYEIRYVTGNPRRLLATVPYQVTAVAATLEGPASVAPDARFEVAWSGPNGGGDFVTIVGAGAAPNAYGSYVDARSGRADEKTGQSVATLRAPAKPGQYELRYVQQGSRVIGSRAIEVTPVTVAPSPFAPRTIPLAGFTATGSSVMVPPRAIPLAGFSAVGASVIVKSRTIRLRGWTAAGTRRGGLRE